MGPSGADGRHTLVQRYWGDDEDAYGEVDHAMRAGGRDAVRLLEELAAGAPDDESLGLLGAGPFEDLVRWEGVRLAAELDAAMKRQPRLRMAVRNVRVGSEQLEADTNFEQFFGIS
jgi:hypothetical protein